LSPERQPQATTKTIAPAPLLVDACEAARILSVSERTLWSLTNTGVLQCVRINRAKRYAMADLTAYVDRLRAEEAARANGRPT
jgi:hypothetical protein